MAKLNVNKVTEIPSDPDKDAIYLVRNSGEEKFKLFTTTSSGEVVELDSINFDNVAGDLVFEFNSPAEEWIVNHNTNRMPVPNIIVNGKSVISDVQYLDNDIFKIIHKKPHVGKVTIPKI